MARELTRAQARAALGDISKAAFTRLVQAGLPRKGEGNEARYVWPLIQRWYMDWKFEEGRRSVRPEDYEEAKARKMMAEAELAELDLAIRRGELMTVAVAEKRIAEAFDRVAAQLKAAPTRHAHDIIGIQTLPEAEARMKRALSETQSELAAAEDVPADVEETA